MTWIVTFLSLTFISAAPHKKDNLDFEVAKLLRNTRFVAADQAKAQGNKTLDKLKEAAFDKSLPMNTRWKSFMVYVEARKGEALPLITSALNHSTWYMRSAGLTALEDVNKRLAHKWAYQIMKKDPALMVRVKAFEILKTSKDAQVSRLFWDKVLEEGKRHEDRNLWLRAEMAKVLLENLKKQDRGRWIRLLHEKDREMQMIATQALQNLSPDTMKDQNKVSYWRSQYPSPKKSL